MALHHPWRALRLEHPEWRVHFAPALPYGAQGMTRWSDKTVWLLSGMNQVERRCSLEHERQHILRGEGVIQDVAEEQLVEQATARTLIPLDMLVDALRWSRHPREVADTCWTTMDVLVCRWRHLHPAERAALADVLKHHAA